MEKTVSHKQTQSFILVLGIIFVAFNLRPAITSVGPLTSIIRTELDLSNGQVGLLTTLPLLAFAMMSFLAPKFGQNIGNERAIFLGLLILILGLIVRVFGSVYILFAGTLLAGIGIAICNVLLPGLVKSRFLEKVGLMTGVYTASLGGFAAISSGISFPLATQFQFGWQFALLIWVALGMVAICIWFPQLKIRPQEKINRQLNQPSIRLTRSKLAWSMTFFIGLQSFLFYCLIAWLPEIMLVRGLSASQGGIMLFILQVVGLPISFITPILAGKLQSQHVLVATIFACYSTAFLGLLFSSHPVIITSCVVLLGVAQGAGFSLALTFFVLRTKESVLASSVSGMAQSLGYLLAAIGPIFIGSLFDRAETMTFPIITFICIALFMFLAGLQSSSGFIEDKYIAEKSEYNGEKGNRI